MLKYIDNWPKAFVITVLIITIGAIISTISEDFLIVVFFFIGSAWSIKWFLNYLNS